MFDAYRVEDQAALPYYDGEGRPMLRRHAINDRQQEQVKARYVAGVLKSGVIDGVRGNPWAVKGVDGVFELISYATLTEAAYAAHRQQPQNEHVKLSVSRGLRQCVLFDPRTPHSVLRFLKEQHNSFHQGSADSII